MLTCPSCCGDSPTPKEVTQNCFRCPRCTRLFFAIHDPFDSQRTFAATSNDSDSPLAVPDDLLLQIPADRSRRNMIFNFSEELACLIVQTHDEESQTRSPEDLRKPAGALRRRVLHVYLPGTLMDAINDRIEQKTV